MTNLRRIYSCIVILALSVLVGCIGRGKTIPERAPRPVEVTVLKLETPPEASLITASAASWKSEEIGFEVGGRVEFVVDDNTEIEGRIYDSEGRPFTEGTPVARIENERYVLQVSRATAEVTRAEQDLIVANTDLNEIIPAQIASATASAELARDEYNRYAELRAQDATTASEYDEKKADYAIAVANVKQAIASEKSKKAEIQSLENAVLQAKQSLRDAERDLEDCTLYASYRGQIADTSVVPGSIVAAGEPVATLQMLDPIKVEVEVSADKSRQLQRTDMFPVHVVMPDGSISIHKGYLHQIDAVADPLTRTFTLTLLLMNKQLTSLDSEKVATTRQVWRLDLKFIPGAENGDLFVPEEAILEDDQGAYLWQITNATNESRSPSDHMFDVRKLRISRLPTKVPYLGNLVFQQVETKDPEFDPNRDLVVGKLNVNSGEPNAWDGKQIYLNTSSRWMLRPGDLVKIDLSMADTSDGYYLPMDAIARRDDKSFIFAVEEAEGETRVKRLPIKVVGEIRNATTSSLQRIEPVGEYSLEGIRCVTAGAHFLIDGEQVRVVSQPENAE